MGLLDQLQAYIEANTPRSTRPVAKPSTVINQGLLNPNKFNSPAANRFKDSAFGLLGVVPGLGDASSVAESADLFNRGENFAGTMAAVGALPLVPAIGGMFIGKGAKTWDALKASQAEDMLKQGIDPREVWKQTGTLKGVDGALRQEIPDNFAAMESGGRFFGTKGGGGKASQVLEHDDLYRAYPEVGDINTSYNFEAPRHGGSFNEGSNYIQVDAPMGYQSAKDTTLHELQHAIQQREGWARGGSPEAMAKEYGLARSRLHFLEQEPDYLEGSKQIDNLWNQAFSSNTMDEAAIAAKEAEIIQQHPSLAEARKVMDTLRQTDEYGFDSYKRLAGEAEARLTQSRMGLDAAQRLQHYPYDMGQYGLDVPLDSLIVRGLLGQ